MKINVLVASKKVLSGEIEFDNLKLGKILSRKGFELNNISIQNFSFDIIEEFINNNFTLSNFCYILCDDNYIDEIIKQNIKTLGSNHQIINEQAVIFSKDLTNLMLIPIESDYLKYIDESLDQKDNDVMVLNIFGKSKSFINEYLENLNKISKNFEYKIYQNGILNDVMIRFLKQDTLFDYETKKKIVAYFDKSVYSQENKSLSCIAFELLKQENKTVSFAESMTGGNIVATLIKENNGASEFVKEGLVTYQRIAKEELLEINKDILDKYTCESTETTFEMAKSLLKKAKTDYVVTITGLATSDDAEDCGKCFIGVGNKDEIHMFKSKFSGTRSEVIEKATQTALFYLIQTIKKNKI